jgi:hypothetical protein
LLSGASLVAAFRCVKHAELARFYPSVVDYIPRGRKPEPEEFAYCRSPAGHSVLKSETVNYRKLFERQHNLQAFFPG